MARLAVAACCVLGAPAELTLKGMSQAAADFGEGSLPGTKGTDYTWPTSDSIQHHAQLGFGVVRLPFRWERLQPSKNSDFATEYWEDLQSTVTTIVDAGQVVILDPHNYARYFGEIIGAQGSSVSIDDFLDFWTRLATHYKDQPKVAFAIMNEPNTMSTSLWAKTAKAAIDAIRDTGATQLVLVPGNGWTGAHCWTETWYDTAGGLSNAEAFADFVDPGNNFAFEMHQYLDSDMSGKSPTCAAATTGVGGLKQATPWLKEHGFRAFLGELSAGNSDVCKQGIDNMLTHMDENSQQWLGWAWWAAGPWWGDSWYSIEANADGSDKPQTAWLLEHLTPVPPSPTPSPSPTPPPTPTPTPPPTPPPAPTPSAGQCCWGASTCAAASDCHADAYCGANEDQCVGNCGGMWCPQSDAVV